MNRNNLRNNLVRVKDETYVINLDGNKSIGIGIG